MTAKELLDRYFLDMRALVLELAAAFDRLDRGANAKEIADDERVIKLRDAVRFLTDAQSDRAERVQLLFSDAYDPAWRKKLRV